MAASEEHLPTLLVFTLGAGCESRRRQLLPASLHAIETRLHQACLEATLAAGRAAGCRLEVSSPLNLGLPSDVRSRSQPGCGFGKRLELATSEAFAEHGGAVILVGSDVPDIDSSHLEGAIQLLEEDDDRVVIGPSPDGGFYLLAASRPLESALGEVRWRCRETLHSLQRALRREGRPVVLLPALADLDQRSDLERWLASVARPGVVSAMCRDARGRRLIASLLRAFAGLKLHRAEAVFFESRWRGTPTPHLRGPPALAAPF